MTLTHKIAALALAALMMTGCTPEMMARYQTQHKDATADVQSPKPNNSPTFDDGTVPGQATVMETGEHAREAPELVQNSNQPADQGQEGNSEQAYSQANGAQSQQTSPGDQPLQQASDSKPTADAPASPANSAPSAADKTIPSTTSTPSPGPANTDQPTPGPASTNAAQAPVAQPESTQNP